MHVLRAPIVIPEISIRATSDCRLVVCRCNFFLTVFSEHQFNPVPPPHYSVGNTLRVIAAKTSQLKELAMLSDGKGN